MSHKCPICNNQLEEVKQSSNSLLNSEQFDAIKAGDWFCRNCRGKEGKSGYKYFWNRELNGSAPLDQWIKDHNFETLKEKIMTHIQMMTSAADEELEGATRCIMASLRQELKLKGSMVD